MAAFLSNHVDKSAERNMVEQSSKTEKRGGTHYKTMSPMVFPAYFLMYSLVQISSQFPKAQMLK
jgi:hypothetical protein